MRRFQNILYVTRGAEEETDSLKQALSLARNNATTLKAVALCPMLPKKLGEYEAGYEASLADRMRASIANAQAELKMVPEEVRATVAVDCGDTPAVRIVRRVLRDAHDLVIKQPEPTHSRPGFRALDMQLLRLCPSGIAGRIRVTTPKAARRKRSRGLSTACTLMFSSWAPSRERASRGSSSATPPRTSCATSVARCSH
jgi:hypothetical protein